MALNKVFLIGNVGKDPEIRHLESGAVVATFTLATTERYKDRSGEAVEQTEWHNIVAWSRQAEFAENFIVKGSQLYVEGRIRSRRYTNSAGEERIAYEIQAENLQLLGKKEGQQPSGIKPIEKSAPRPERRQAPEPQPQQATLDIDDLPF